MELFEGGKKMTVDLEEKVIQTFQYLHQHPEISWEEKNTTRYIKELLAASGCKVTVFPDCTGVVGEYGTGKNVPVVGIRADMDALWQNVDGTFQANHSCGHDAHMAMVLGVLWKLEQHKELAAKLRIKFIFQPAEETGEGDLKMVEKNVIDDVDLLFGVHLRPGQEMKLGQASPVIVHGATKVYEVEIRGEDAHGARPHLNVNAIEVSTDIVQMLAKIHLNPQIPYSVKMTRFHAGGKSANIIPGNAEFALDLRAQTNEAMEELEKQVESIFAAIRTRHNIRLEVVNELEIAAAIVNQEATEIM